MATREELRIPPRLYLVTDPVTDAASLGRALSQAVRAADVAAVMLQLPTDLPDRDAINLVKQIAPLVQDGGAAVLLAGWPGIVDRAGADGAHLDGVEAFSSALPRLKPDRIAGVGGLSTRHDAMVAAETGADYVMFGGPGTDLTVDSVVERVSWWSEVFQIQCVGFAGELGDLTILADAGADFVAIGESLWRDAAAMAGAAARLELESA